MKLILCDRSEVVVAAWRAQFAEHPEVEIRLGDLFACEARALVLPGNAFGFLDRGLELEFCERFGWDLQDHLRREVRERFHGELLVGQALTLPVGDGDLRLVYAAIVRTPVPLAGSLHAYLAARGAFLELRREDPESAVFPGLGTGPSGLHPLISARQLRYAYELFSGKRGLGDKNLPQLQRREQKLRSLPRTAAEAETEGDPAAGQEQT
jgi:O-acetyl-ADP-ribose deacetylase (regulator of RNase III)